MSSVLLIVLGGLFGVVLGRALEAAPKWAFYVVLAAFLLLAVYFYRTGNVV